MNLDQNLFATINQSLRLPMLDMLCPIARDKWTWIPCYVIAAFYLLYRFRLKGLWLILVALLTIAISDQASNLIKHYSHRLRPCHVEEGVRLLVAKCSDSFSFPSSHAANHFALAVFLIMGLSLDRSAAIGLLLWAGFIAFSQVYVGLHYPSDVLAGALFGSTIGYCVAICYHRILAYGQKKSHSS